MKKKILILVTLIITMLTFCSCSSDDTDEPYGWHNQMETNYETSYQLLLNRGSCFVYTFKDEVTGVWYISTNEGVTPRLNVDGSLYTG